jgi:hypothetical protein
MRRPNRARRALLQRLNCPLIGGAREEPFSQLCEHCSQIENEMRAAARGIHGVAARAIIEFDYGDYGEDDGFLIAVRHAVAPPLPQCQGATMGRLSA